jgi:translation elongation factor P/translation initiation factor 5A
VRKGEVKRGGKLERKQQVTRVKERQRVKRGKQNSSNKR